MGLTGNGKISDAYAGPSGSNLKKKQLLVNFVHNFVSQNNKYTMILQVWTSILISMKMKSLVSALF